MEKESDKYDTFKNGLANRKSQASNEIFFNGMNAVQGRPSWEVCVHMHNKVVEDLKKNKLGCRVQSKFGCCLDGLLRCR